MEGTDISPEKLTKQIAQARKAAGMSHWEFARMLDVPVCFTEILENGILFCDGENHFSRWPGCPLTGVELGKIAGALSGGAGSLPGKQRIDEEFVFYYPITVNSNALMDEARCIADCSEPVSYREKHIAYDLGMKYRIFHGQTCMQNGREAADAVKERVLAAFAEHESFLCRGKAPYPQRI